MLLVCVVLFCVVFVSGGSRNLEGTSLRNCQREQKPAAVELTFVPITDYANFIPDIVYQSYKGFIYILKAKAMNNVTNYAERIVKYYIIKFL